MVKKKILRVITRLERGGVPYEVLYITKNPKINEMYEQVIATGYTKDEIPIPEGVKVVRIKNLTREISPLRDILALFELVIAILREKPDILHLHTSKAGFLGRIAGKLCKVQNIIYSPHGHVFYGYFSKPKVLLISALEYLTSYFTDVIVIRTDEEKGAFESIGCRTTFFQVPKAPLKREEISQQDSHGTKDEREVITSILAKKKSGYFIAGTIARLEPVKGIEYFIKSFPLIKSRVQNTFFVIVGDGSQRTFLHQLAEKLIAPDNFIFTGWVDSPDEIYKTLDVFVVPSLNEAWGVTILEAGRFGIPIVASSVGGIPYFAGGYVRLVPPRNIQAIADSVVEILSSPKLRKTLSLRSKELYSKYSEDIMIQKYLELYEFVLKRRK